MKRFILLAPALLLLGAFADAETGTIQPGEWETTTRFTSVEMPGIPENVAREMETRIAAEAQTQRRCITPEQAANPTERIVESADIEGCEFSEATFSGGRIHIRSTCPVPEGGGQMNLSWEGRYTETTMEGDLTTELTGGQQDMRMAGTITSRRIGDCPGS